MAKGGNAGIGWALVLVSAAAFAGVATLAWAGTLGFKAMGLLFLATLAYFAGRRMLEKATRKPVDTVAKVLFTIVGCMALLRHPIEIEGQGSLPIYAAISEYITQVDGKTFVMFALVAMGVKFIGVISSAFAWHLLLVGQGIRYPFWSKIFTAFLIGRFIGTFLPSTIGLDGYTLYEAGTYSNRWSRVITAKALEKFIGVTGLFLCMVVTLPWGYPVIIDVTANAGNPEAAPMLAAAIGLVAGGVSAVVVVGLVWPVFLVKIMEIVTVVAGVLSGKIPGVNKEIAFVIPDDMMLDGSQPPDLDVGAGNRTLGPFLAHFGPQPPPLIGITRLMACTVSDKIVAILERFTGAVGAYHGKVGLLMLALGAKFVTHFTTMAVYFFTALAIGVVTAEFWPIVFGSSIQILATLLSPTIAGEGAREAFQALLLQNQLGGVAQAVLSGALGFIAAEAATMWGGVFLWTRVSGWRPKFALVDGEQVDYAWIDDDEGGFDAERIAALQKKHVAEARAGADA